MNSRTPNELGSTAPPGTLVVSLDFELHWGVRDHLTVAQYRDNLLGARRVVPRLLELFTRYGIHATWAVVGALMVDSRRELEGRLGLAVPAEHEHGRDVLKGPVNGAARAPRPAAADLSGVGEDEASDAFHFAPGLVRLIARTPHQEIGTHTFSHFFCQAPGQTANDFRRDLRAAIATADEKLHRRTESLVFPRNQVNEAYLPLCGELGIAAYRSTERAWFYRPGWRSGAPLRRALRFLDAYVDLSGPNVHAPRPSPGRPLDIPSSRFLRPYSPALRLLDPLRVRRVTSAMAAAARTGRVFHLWWHPHNFGTNEGENLAALSRILDRFVALRGAHGMRSLTMGELARECRGARNG